MQQTPNQNRNVNPSASSPGPAEGDISALAALLYRVMLGSAFVVVAAPTLAEPPRDQCLQTSASASGAAVTLAAPSTGAEPSTGGNDAPSYYGRPLAYWRAQLKNISPRSANARYLVPPLLGLVQNTALPSGQRQAFAAYLARVDPPARALAPILADMLQQRNKRDASQDFIWAARVLALMGNGAEQATPALVQLLDDSNLSVEQRQSAVAALANIGAAHPDALPALMQRLRRRPRESADERELRFWVAKALFVVGPDAAPSVPLLVRMIRDRGESTPTRRHAIDALGPMGSAARPALPVLLEELAASEDPAMRDAAAKSLVLVDVQLDQSDGRAIAAAMRHADAEIRWRVAKQLGQVKPLPRPWRNMLHATLHDRNPLVQLCAAESLAAHWPSAPTLGLTAVALLSGGDRKIGVRAKRVLLGLPQLDLPTRRALQACCDSSNRRAAALARATLRQLAPPVQK